MRVRVVRDEDAALLAAVCAQAGHRVLPATMAWQIERLQASPDEFVLVALMDAEEWFAGWIHAALVYPFGGVPHAELRALVVAPEWRGHGVGSALVAAAERWVTERGLDTVETTVDLVRARMQQFLRHRGYDYEATAYRLRRQCP